MNTRGMCQERPRQMQSFNGIPRGWIWSLLCWRHPLAAPASSLQPCSPSLFQSLCVSSSPESGLQVPWLIFKTLCAINTQKMAQNVPKGRATRGWPSLTEQLKVVCRKSWECLSVHQEVAACSWSLCYDLSSFNSLHCGRAQSFNLMRVMLDKCF